MLWAVSLGGGQHETDGIGRVPLADDELPCLLGESGVGHRADLVGITYERIDRCRVELSALTEERHFAYEPCVGVVSGRRWR